MPGILSALNEHVKRLARREVRAETRRTKKASSQHRRDIASLKRQLREMAGRLRLVEKRAPRAGATIAAAEGSPEGLRFRADGLRSHRERLGISAQDYGRLVGVSALTIYHWEAGKAKPRRKQLPAIAAVRSLGKREVLQRLGGK